MKTKNAKQHSIHAPRTFPSAITPKTSEKYNKHFVMSSNPLAISSATKVSRASAKGKSLFPMRTTQRINRGRPTRHGVKRDLPQLKLHFNYLANAQQTQSSSSLY